MLPPSSLRRALSGLVALTLAATVGLSLAGSPAYAANPVTPGTYRGLGFDQCDAPSQSAMSTWIKKSPFRAAGIYISGNSRACRTQKNLTPTWVRTQLAAGWHLMPITLGPQASCATRFPRYGKSIDPTINPSSTNTYAAARNQAGAEARKAVSVARGLGIVAGSTIFYDLEGFNASTTSACRLSALQFLGAWTRQLHALGYASGVYSSASSGIRMLDDARVTPGNTITLPDQLWIADWNGKADTSSTYVRSGGWQPYKRAKQYQGGHNETWGGVRINIDRNYLDLRTPKLPAGSTPAPAPTPTPAPGPAYTGTSLSDPRCSPATINHSIYHAAGPTSSSAAMVPLQCLLKQQRRYPYAVTGTWNTQTRTALRGFQSAVGHPVADLVSRSDWVSLLSKDAATATLRSGAQGADVTRAQRALNAAGTPRLTITGTYDAATAAAVGQYQQAVGLTPTRELGSWTWAKLKAGRL